MLGILGVGFNETYYYSFVTCFLYTPLSYRIHVNMIIVDMTVQYGQGVSLCTLQIYLDINKHLVTICIRIKNQCLWTF